MRDRGVADLPFVRLKRHSTTELREQLYEQLRDAMLRGLLRPGTRLPSTRDLAHELGVSRNTSVAAYRQLELEGFILSKVGSGAIVSESLPALERDEEPDTDAEASAVRLSRRGKELSRNDSTSLLRVSRPRAFRLGVPGFDHFPFKVWSTIVQDRWRLGRIEHLMYANSEGYLPLRRALSTYLGAVRGVLCEPERIVVTAGCQQALSLAARLFADEGDTIAVEDPGYLAARAAFRSAGLVVRGIPVDAEGIDVSRLEALKPRPKLVYVTPSHQYPLGMTMSIARRVALLDWATRRKVTILEDDYNSEYRYEGRPVAALQGLRAGAPVVYVGTFSKILYPALRIGYMVVPRKLAGNVVFARSVDGLHSHHADQAVLAEFIAEGHLERHIRRMRSIYKERRRALVEGLGHAVPDLEVMPSQAGMHVVAKLPHGANDRRIVKEAAERGLELTALSRFYAHERAEQGLIMGFSGFDVPEIEAGVGLLAQIARSCF